MCYYKLDYYDVSLEILAVYLQAFPGSAVAMNLKVRNARVEADVGSCFSTKIAQAINSVKCISGYKRMKEQWGLDITRTQV